MSSSSDMPSPLIRLVGTAITCGPTCDVFPFATVVTLISSWFASILRAMLVMPMTFECTDVVVRVL